MYQTKYKKFYLKQMTANANIKKRLLNQKILKINEQIYRCFIFKLKHFNDYRIFNQINVLEEKLVLCFFKHLNADLDLNITFSVVEINTKYEVINIYENLNFFGQNQINEQSSYWLISTNNFKHLSINVGNSFFIT